MYKKSLSRSVKLKQLNAALTAFNKLKNIKPAKTTPVQLSKLNQLSSLTKELNNLKNQLLTKRENEIKKEIDKLGNKIKLSSFSLMEHDFRENTHSNILEYIFDYKLIGIEGAILLSDFISELKEDSGTLSSLIKKRNYIIEREYSVKGGRIDLLILDEKNKFVIVIENKIFASVSEKEIMAEEELNYKSQLNPYIDHLDKYDKTYHKLHILLSYKPIETPDKYKPFISVDYNYLYNILQSNEDRIKDSIFDDYRLLLHSLINDLYKQKKDLFRQLITLHNNQEIKSPSLNSLEQIRILLNAYK